ncbi:DNA topoisomerase IV subunit A [Mycoplasma sp. 3341]|uniref:DNA topoisomerase IV subunit A n=1 Tax=Mycoplasma sp. 3341 TaxID=3447506 RepID=UPI003F65D6BD
MAKNRDEIIEKIINESLDIIMSNGFNRYSKYVIQQRALPDARDGLKPVQRRILYSMWEMSLTNDKPFKKSARVVGDVIGRFHPHGDSSIYEALIRMSQEWKMALPLIEMHGNKGSIDDDPAAAMRYTETRLEKIANPLMGEIDKKIVSFAPNFDDTEYEPTVLPTYFPNLLANGAKGIAEGYATEIPPHNLNELLDACVKIIQNPHISNEKLLQIIQGPDFPTGGIISDIDGFKEAFETGKGRVEIYAKHRLVYDKNNNVEAIEILEIPYGVVKVELIKQIDNLIFNKTINGIKEVRDQSSRNGISIYIELETESNAQAILNYLFEKTDLKKYFNYNMVAICDNAPKLLGIRQLLDIFLKHLFSCKTDALKYDFEKISRRLEIVEGLIRVSEISDAVIKLIRESDNSKKGVIEALMREFKFTELQATAIAELRLYKLSRMDQLEYQKERQELQEQINCLDLLLTNEQEFKKFLIDLLHDIKKTYALPRRSEISHVKIETEINTKALAKNEDFYVFVSNDGYIKRLSSKIFNANSFDTYNLKENDFVIFGQEINSLSQLLFFTSQGNYFVINGFDLKENGWKELGTHASDYARLEGSEKIVAIYNLKNARQNNNVLLVSKYGVAKQINLEELSQQTNRKFLAIKLKDESDELVAAQIVSPQSNIFVLLSDGLYQYFENSQIPLYSLKASGVQMTKLNDNYVAKVLVMNENDKLLLSTSQGQFKKALAKNIVDVKRVNVPKVFYYILKNKPIVIQDIATYESGIEFWYTSQENKLQRWLVEDIPASQPKESFGAVKINDLNVGRFIKNVFISPDKNSKTKILDESENDNLDVDVMETFIFDEPLSSEEIASEQKEENEPKHQKSNQDNVGIIDWFNVDALIEKANNLEKNNKKN